MNGSDFDLGEALQLSIDLVLDFSADFLAFIVIAAFIAAFAFYFGRDRIVPLLAGIYAAVPLYSAFPYTDLLTTPLLHVGLFVVLAIAGLVVFSGLSAFIAEGSLGFIKLIIFAAVTAGMIIAIAIHVLPVEEMYSFSAATKALFSSTEALFLWLIAPLVAVYVFGRG